MIDPGAPKTRRWLQRSVFGRSEEAFSTFLDHYEGAIRAGNRMAYDVAMILTREEFVVRNGTWTRKVAGGVQEAALSEPGIDPGGDSALYYRVRQADPGRFDSFSTSSIGKGITAVFGRDKETGRWSIQSLRFRKTTWTPGRIRAWCRDHGFSTNERDFEGGEGL